MKKLISLLLICILLLGSTGTAFAAMVDEEVMFTLAGYGIIDADTPADNLVSRGEFAHMVAVLLGFGDREYGTSVKTPYWDVPEDYEYAGDISLLTGLGIFNGVPQSLFSPYDAVTYEQAIKVLVVITGYGNMAVQNGGYPSGYVTMAGSNKMLDDVSLANPFSRNDLYKLIYNTLDVQLINEVFTNGQDEILIKTNDTLRDRLANETGDELYRHTGVITANSYTYTTSPYSDLHDDEVVIENATVGGTYIYKIGKTNAFDLVGCKVDFYAKKVGSEFELLSIRPTDGKKTVQVSAADLDSKSGNTISCTDEGGKTKRLNLDTQIKVVYNGSRVMSPDDSIFEFEDGYVCFIDNDTDTSYDLAMIWSYENAIATSFDGERFNFANDARYSNLTSLFADSDDDTVKMLVTDKDGNRVESFETEHTVSIFADRNQSRYRIIVSNEQIEGQYDSFGDNVISIDGREYFVAESLGGDMILGESYLIYVNHEGKLAFAKVKNGVNYAYVLDYGAQGGLSCKVSAKLILPGKVDAGVEVNEEDSTDTSRVPYLILQNSGARIFDFAEKVKCNGSRYSGDDLLTLLAQPGMEAISYELNQAGEISQITPLTKHGGDLADRYQYDVYDKVFGGTTVDQTSGFALDSDTLAVCVPADDKNNILNNASDDDLGLKVNITVANNDVGYRVAGYDYDESTKKVKFLVVLAAMDATVGPTVNAFTSRASMVTSVRYVLNTDTGEAEQVIELLNGSTKKTLKPIVITESNKRIQDIKEGDLIVYTTNNNDLMANVFIVQSVPALKNEFISEATSTSVKRTFGRTGAIEYDEVDTYNRALVTNIDVYVGDSPYPIAYSIPQKNSPPVYVYNTIEDSYSYASLKEIRPNSDKIYIFERKGDGLVRAIVLVR